MGLGYCLVLQSERTSAPSFDDLDDLLRAMPCTMFDELPLKVRSAGRSVATNGKPSGTYATTIYNLNVQRYSPTSPRPARVIPILSLTHVLLGAPYEIVSSHLWQAGDSHTLRSARCSDVYLIQV